jgi:hypothetical protein
MEASVVGRAAALEDNDPTYERPRKKICLETEPKPNRVLVSTSGQSYFGSHLMKDVYRKLRQDMDNRLVLERGATLFNQEGFPDLTSEELAAMSGHMLGATATVTPADFERQVTSLVQRLDDDPEKVAEFYRQARLARFLMEADYLMTDKYENSNTTVADDDVSAVASVLPLESKWEIHRSVSITAFPVKFGNLEGQCDQASAIFKSQNYGRRRSTSGTAGTTTVGERNETRKNMRGSTLMVVVNLILFISWT